MSHPTPPPERLRIVLSPALGFAGDRKDVLAGVEQGVKCFEDMGHAVELTAGLQIIAPHHRDALVPSGSLCL